MFREEFVKNRNGGWINYVLEVAEIAIDITISLRSGELDAPRIILNFVTCGQVFF